MSSRAEQIGELRRLSGGEDGGEQPDVADIFTVTPADIKDSGRCDKCKTFKKVKNLICSITKISIKGYIINLTYCSVI